jgi:hypothetical protein
MRIHTTGMFQDLPQREPNTWFIDSKLIKKMDHRLVEYLVPLRLRVLFTRY